MARKKMAENAGMEIEKVVKDVEAAVGEKLEAVSEKMEDVSKKVTEAVEESKPEIQKAVKTAKAKTGAAAKKAAATVKKTVKKFEPKKTGVVFEAYGKSFYYDDVVKKVTKACKGKTAGRLDIYINAEEGAAYYVLDGEVSPDYRVEL